ncbi:PKD domain-containing protein [Fibrisoma montanum]|uniref:PKD domain-containing protein n=1 Tax=Fibrisoma montanum TaxID=2305895 RepID=A0A418MIA0_9BACT|nr:PKD domain-containing protein [Fibrisoma montanum]RIV27168.1 PKD domain-containing protein [Fibrisoma montanum]
MASYSNLIRLACVSLGCGLLLSACAYEELPEADYPQQLLYQPTARNGVYTINSLPPATGTYRFSVNLADKKLIIPLSVFRGGVSTAGEVAVTVTANADTVARLITANALPGTAPLPTDKFVLPNTLNLGDGDQSVPFDLRIDLDYLRANTGQKLAVGVTIASAQTPVNPALKTTIISLDPSILKPTPNFTNKADATTPRKITFTNTSANALSYSWDFGDKSAPVTEASPTYTYANAGTYTVTLTATGITGSQDATKKTLTVTVP